MSEELLSAVRAGDRRAVGRLCRLLEEGGAGGLTRALYSAPGTPPWTIGVTGSPGVGKSTLVAALISELRAAQHRVGVIAVDPSSPFSGGAILGDRIRMQRHSADDGVFIRSVASRGTLGGLARATADMAEVMRVWGASVVVIETVGVGQDEHDVMLLADTTLLVLAPGLGDELQANKAGIMEVADVFAVNKADLPGASRMVTAIEGALSLVDGAPTASQHAAHHATSPHGARGNPGEGRPQVLQTVASTGEGLAELLASMELHRTWLATPAGRARRQDRRRRAARRRLEVALVDAVTEEVPEQFSTQAERVAAGSVDPMEAARRVLESYDDELRKP